MKKHVYIAHHTRDATFVKYMRETLRAAGFPIWEQDRLIPGTLSWNKAIGPAIKDACCVVVLLSPDAKLSKWLERELFYASLYGVNITPMLVRGDPYSAIPSSLAVHRWHDGRDLDRALKTVVSEVRRVVSQ